MVWLVVLIEKSNLLPTLEKVRSITVCLKDEPERFISLRDFPSFEQSPDNQIAQSLAATPAKVGESLLLIALVLQV